MHENVRRENTEKYNLKIENVQQKNCILPVDQFAYLGFCWHLF